MIIYLQMIESDEDKSKFEQLYIMYKGLMFHVAMKILKNANGLSYRKELVFTLLLLLLSIGAGYLLIQRKDLISLEK